MIGMKLKEAFLSNQLANTYLSWLATSAAIDTDMYLGERDLSTNSFSKLARILKRTIKPRQILKGRREIDQDETMKYYQKCMETHLKKHPRSQYKLKEGITQITDLANELTPIIFNISNDLSDLSKLPREKLEELKSLSLTFSNVAVGYGESFKRCLVA